MLFRQDAYHYLNMKFRASFPTENDFQFVFQISLQADGFSIGDNPVHDNFRVWIAEKNLLDFIRDLKTISTTGQGQAETNSVDEKFVLEVNPFDKFGYLLIKATVKYPASNMVIHPHDTSFENQFQGYLRVEQGKLKDWIEEMEGFYTERPYRSESV